MTSRPDHWLPALLLTLAGGAVIGSPLAASPADDAKAEALAAVERGDGVAAEIAGKRALAAGAARSEVAALIGEGELLQQDYDDAREWLGPAEFDAATNQRGLHALARLEIHAQNYPAAAAAFDRIMAESTPNTTIAADIGRLRYRTGEHHGALEVAEAALRIDPQDPQAMLFMGQLRRDAMGARSALELLRAAAQTDPSDPELASNYAATLGEAGENAAMLAVLRELVKVHADDPQAFYLQAVLAARAGQDDLARRLWWRTNAAFDRNNAGLVLTGALEYRSGNAALAVERFAQLRRQMAASPMPTLLFARALVANGEANVAVRLLEPIVQRADASPYAITLLARAYEQLGLREDAGRMLDRASGFSGPSASAFVSQPLLDSEGRALPPVDLVQRLRLFASNGEVGRARAELAGLTAEVNGSADLQLLAGDAALLAGDGAGAMAQYRQAALIRRNWPMLQRLVALQSAPGNSSAARREVAQYLMQNQRDHRAAALYGRLLSEAGEHRRAVSALRLAASMGAGPRDPLLLADLAAAELAAGESEAALANARRAHALARSNARVAQVLAQALQAANRADPAATALLAKARSLSAGD